MRRVTRVAVAGFLLVGVAVAGSRVAEWRRDRVADCEQRGAQFAGLALLNSWPAGLQPSESYAGCDEDRIVAYGGRQYHGPNAQGAVAEFFRGVVEQAGWQVASGVLPTGDNAALLCADTRIDGAEAYLSLSIAVEGTYEVSIADDLDSGPRCR